MRIDEKYKRLIKLLFSTILLSMVVAIYSFVWTGYYNRIIENPFFRRGNWMMIFLYGVLLVFFMQLYGGFKVGYLRKGNLIYSQLLSVALVNIFTYLQIAVLDKHFFSIVPMAVMTVFDFFVIIIWTLVFQLFYQWIFPPRRMLLIAGNRSDYHLLQKMNSREDKYEIKDLISYKKGLNLIFKKVHNFDGVILGDMPSHERNQILKYCFSHNIRTYSVPKISDILMRSSSELTLFDTPMLLSRNDGLTIEQEFCKRTMDVVLSLIGAIITLPFFLVIAICIKATDGGPVFYKQTRLTKDGKEFEIIKFRTMIQDAEKQSGARLASEGDDRILPVGKLLRRLRLDELPQIYNILKGEMSLVGPRPERPELAAEIEKEIPEFAYRLKVKAGLTGYAQVYGKYNTTFYDKLKQDLVYIRNYSVWLDLKLMIMTPKIMFMKESTEGVQK
ncbi:exopolysaccharide biosynthesis polyprenyl glycosylphosphotransferase [Lachnoclostridium edouardi]|uniref:exopolysaccharide biosynthesis polyprenyl glycosylphosphotransferase n=1 Tax=Lachnoclostridium edouardi TaxID=1926283 RepID=UPI000C7D4793|nr:exopolysaccharide biosynthesis polyprenyl glycosylphosphotransferase [Lachnoclostridium edouardi]